VGTFSILVRWVSLRKSPEVARRLRNWEPAVRAYEGCHRTIGFIAATTRPRCPTRAACRPLLLTTVRSSHNLRAINLSICRRAARCDASPR
jgi:hypothetical protein